MARVAFCLAGPLALSLFAFPSDGSAAAGVRAGFAGGHGSFRRAHGAGRLHHGRLSHFGRGRFGHRLPIFLGADWPGDSGPYASGSEPGPAFYGAPSFAAIPATTGIQSAPPAPPAIYVINSAGPYRHGRVRKGYAPYPGPRVLSMARRPQWDAPYPGEIGYPAVPYGPRIIHVSVPQGL